MLVLHGKNCCLKENYENDMQHYLKLFKRKFVNVALPTKTCTICYYVCKMGM